MKQSGALFLRKLQELDQQQLCFSMWLKYSGNSPKDLCHVRNVIINIHLEMLRLSVCEHHYHYCGKYGHSYIGNVERATSLLNRNYFTAVDLQMLGWVVTY